MPLLRLQQSALRRSQSTSKRSRADLPGSTGLLVFKCGTSAQSLMARIILLPYACLHKRGAKFLGTKMPRSSSQFSPTKICEASAKRLRQLLTQFFFPRCAANALQILRSWRKFSKTLFLFVGQELPLPATSGCRTISITQSVGEALNLARAKPTPILVTGSLHFAGEVLAHLRGKPSAFEECAQ